MIRILNTSTNEIVAEIVANRSMTIEEMLECAGAERITPDHPEWRDVDCGDYYLNGERIFVEELKAERIELYESNDPATKIQGLRKLTGLSQTKFGERYGIPMRTIQSWELGDREAPEYVIDLLERVVWEDEEGIGLSWCVVDYTTDDMAVIRCTSRKEALNEAGLQWAKMSAHDQERRIEFYVGLMNVDERGYFRETENGENDCDVRTVAKSWK